MTYSILLWCSHPDNNNDDCNTGIDVDTMEQVELVIEHPFDFFSDGTIRSTKWFEIDGMPECPERYRRNVHYVPSNDNDDDWRQEYAMQCGMAFGCAGYNDAMGY